MNMDKRIEEVSLNAWPSLQTLVYDGWLLRFAGGFTKRANSINPIYHSQSGLEEKIAACERLYREKLQPAIYKITPFINPPHLDAVLHEKGYGISGQTSVQRRSLDQIEEPVSDNVRFSDVLEEGWLEDYCRLNGVGESERPSLRSILSNIAPQRRYVSLTVDGSTIACGMGVLEDGLFGLFDLVVDPEYRNRGYGKQLILNLLKAGREMGGKFAYLQVVLDNAAALKLYSNLGFKEAYRYWYRVKTC